ncbi:hypothetical protein B7P43_G09755 [Cryptotermes secundus]|uniref:Uncharacterized protein n=1 Tax=Cryptotermes secundus TaxID=105785 RepID=A0A2J7RSJ7_9NEOP|nr:hypothetical protein B7P43_G09755 [Cryptotermes secundus]
MTDGTWVHISGHVNTQNVRISSNENPHTIQQVPLHSEKLGVWCAVSPRRIIGPLFFHETLNSDRYINGILNPFFKQLSAEERQYEYFQEESATAHTARCEVCFQAEGGHFQHMLQRTAILYYLFTIFL